MRVTIRPAAPEDLEALLILYRNYHRGLLACGMNYDINEAALPRVLESKIRSRLILAAVAQGEDGELLGFVFCSILRLSGEYLCRGESSVGYLNDLYVVEKARGQGIARQLTDRAEAWLRENGITTMELQVLGKNEAAQAYWQQQGMEPIGILCCKYL